MKPYNNSLWEGERLGTAYLYTRLSEGTQQAGRGTSNELRVHGLSAICNPPTLWFMYHIGASGWYWPFCLRDHTTRCDPRRPALVDFNRAVSCAWVSYSARMPLASVWIRSRRFSMMC